MADSYLGMPGNHSGKIFDKELELAASDSSVATTGSDPVLIGSGLVDADLVIDITTPAAAATTVTLQFATDAAFTAAVAGPSVSIAKDQSGRIIMPFRNDPAGTPLAYARIVPSAAATLGAFIAKR